jgi:beta-N-acetylhexosaminidase
MTDFMWTADLIDPSYSDQIPSAQALIKDAQAQGIRVIVISAGLPYDLSLLSEADALLAVFCQVGAPNVDEAFNPTGAFGPGIPGALNVIFGKTKPSGKLPVNIPAVSEGTFAGENAYTRGTGLTW